MMALATRLATRWGSIVAGDVPDEALEVARQCTLDWVGCAVAGSAEPLATILVEQVVDREGPGPSTVIGRAATATARTAALLNGASGHALDFDDTHLMLSGHPTTPVLPAALAVAEELDLGGEALLVALVVGIEVECRLGAMVNPEHYNAGWHSTGTLGTIGAAAAVSHLMGLDTDQFATAICLAATQASGLKASFGTMAKPLHAGLAASAGVLAARLASGGFTAEPTVLEASQGLGRAAGGAVIDEARLDRLARLDDRWVVRDTLFKHHAACYLTHASINASARLGAKVDPRDIESIEVRVAPEVLDVCAIPEPTTGLEGKFSLRATAAMALLGDVMGDAATYSDSRVRSPEVVDLRDRVTVIAEAGRTTTRSLVVIHTRGGDRLEAEDDTSRPADDLALQWSLLSAKAAALMAPRLGAAPAGAVIEAVGGLTAMPSVRAFAALLR